MPPLTLELRTHFLKQSGRLGLAPTPPPRNLTRTSAVKSYRHPAFVQIEPSGIRASHFRRPPLAYRIDRLVGTSDERTFRYSVDRPWRNQFLP